VRRGILLPIVLYALQPEDEKIADQFMADPRVQQEWEGQTLDYREIITHVAIWRARTDGLPDQDHPGERYRPRRILVSFHRVAEVKGFVARHERIMRFLAERHPELAPVDDGMAFGFVGSTPAGQREEIHEAVSTLRWADDKPLGYAVIAQCGALTESYDMPDLDMAILVTPKYSTVAIQQLIGRITRKPVAATGKKWASVLTTDLVTDSAELADTIIAGVVRALMAQSDTFRHQLQETEVEEDNRRPPVRIASDIDGQLPDDFFEKLRLAFVPVTPEPWFPKFLAHLDEYRAEHGNVLGPNAYVCSDQYALGRKINQIRQSIPGQPGPTLRLTPEWVRDLDARGFIRSVPALLFQEFISHFSEYVAQHGDVLVPQNYVCPDGYKLGLRVSAVRQSHSGSRRLYSLTPERIAELDALGFVWRVRSPNGSQSRIARALTEASRPLLVLEIANLTGLAASNVAKCPREFEGEGRAVRCGKTRGGHGGADLWQAAQTTGSGD
jgi:Helicase associated domain